MSEPNGIIDIVDRLVHLTYGFSHSLSVFDSSGAGADCAVDVDDDGRHTRTFGEQRHQDEDRWTCFEPNIVSEFV
jgi:hypothetical protein